MGRAPSICKHLLIVATVVIMAASCHQFVAAKSVRGAQTSSSVASLIATDTFFNDWRSTKQLLDFMDHLGKSYKAKSSHEHQQVSVTSIGKSAEKRPLKLMSIGPTKPQHQVFLMGTVHGREWISPASLCYLALELASGRLAAELDSTLAEVLKETQVHILPLLNPDGYEYTRSALQPASTKGDATRLWRKNRRNLCSTCERAAHGIDLNRNWGIAGVTFGFGATRSTSDVSALEIKKLN
jgi:murein tripeptide amidase MpaA